MIEIVSQARCVACDLCVRVCPTNVFDAVPNGPPAIARQEDCQTCFICEAYCPVDALFVAPLATSAPAGSPYLDEVALASFGLMGSYRRAVGWDRRRQGVAADQNAAGYYRLRDAG